MLGIMSLKLYEKSIPLFFTLQNGREVQREVKKHIDLKKKKKQSQKTQV